MQSLTHLLHEEWFLRALIVSIMVGAVCGVLGCFIVLKNMSLIGDALSHSVLPGVVVGFIFFGQNVVAFFTGSVLAGLLTAIIISWLQQRLKAKNDAAIGIVFSTMFSLGVIGISYLSRTYHVHLDLKDFLFGNILGIQDNDVLLTLVVSTFVLFSIISLFKFFYASTFQEDVARTMGINTTLVHYFLMLLLSFAVVSSMQAVGVILVVAMLIIPASTALLLSFRLQSVLVISAFLGVGSCISGMLFSVWLQTAPGPMITVTAAFIYLLAVLFSPKNGVLFLHFKNKKMQMKIWEDDCLKLISKNINSSKSYLQEEIKWDTTKWNRVLKSLQKKDFIEIAQNEIRLTKTGNEQAQKLIRAHRLWETYLVNRLGVQKDEIHQWAEDIEHLLNDEMVERLNKRLGFPDVDPHGSEIPK